MIFGIDVCSGQRIEATALTIVTGGNDPRVPASKADRIVKAIRAKGGTVWHILGQNEGHSFAKKENQDYDSGRA